MQDRYRMESQRTNLAMALVAVLTGACGLVLMYLSSLEPVWVSGTSGLRSLVASLGNVLITSTSILLIWELIAKRMFFDEIMSKVGIASELRASGIMQIEYSPAKIEWDRLFDQSREVEVFFAYGTTWRGNNEKAIAQFLSKRGRVLRVVLPNPENPVLMNTLAATFDKKVEALRNRVEEAYADFRNFAQLTKGHGSRVEIASTDSYPAFSYYRFDHTVVLALYSMQRIKGTVPHFVLREGGLYDFAEAEFKAISDRIDIHTSKAETT